MNVFHITYEPNHQILDIHFWGCNLNCRGCYKNYEIYDLGLSNKTIFGLTKKPKAHPPKKFLSLEEILDSTKNLDPKSIIFMGKEAAVDLELPQLAAALKKHTNSHHMLLTNGYEIPDLTDIDEIVFSFKAFSPVLHNLYTRKSNEQILANFKRYYASGKTLQAEIAYIPGLIEDDEIYHLSRFIQDIDKNIPFRITSYFAVPDAPWRSATVEQVESAAMIAKRYLKNVTTVTSNEKNSQWKPVVIA
ncbi:MAG: radical SAM protein [Dehalogenimonas sp.]